MPARETVLIVATQNSSRLPSAAQHTSSRHTNHSASSQVFFLLKESELTPSGANLLDGRYAVFGYAVQGQDALGTMKVCVCLGRIEGWGGG
jgi:cyclophilin family peptidyl-prolyl cis-trans isomerase